MGEEEARRRYEQFLGKLQKLESLSEGSRWLQELTRSVCFQDAETFVDLLLEKNYPKKTNLKARKI